MSTEVNGKAPESLPLMSCREFLAAMHPQTQSDRDESAKLRTLLELLEGFCKVDDPEEYVRLRGAERLQGNVRALLNLYTQERGRSGGLAHEAENLRGRRDALLEANNRAVQAKRDMVRIAEAERLAAEALKAQNLLLSEKVASLKEEIRQMREALATSREYSDKLAALLANVGTRLQPEVADAEPR